MNKDYTRWFIPMDKNLTIDQIVQDGGFYDIDGLWNSIISIEGKLYRGRVETLILDGTTLFMAPDKHRAYRVPGGSLDKGVENARQAENECKEEARILVKNTTYTGIHYIREYENKRKPEPGKVIWEGTYTEVYVAEFDKYYNGYIDQKDQDPGMANEGRFRELSEVKDILTKPHKEALKDILDQVINPEPAPYIAKESSPVLTKEDIDNFFMLTEEDINESTSLVGEDKIYPYFTPEEMMYLGVMSESGNYYSDKAKVDNYTKDWFQNYRSNGKVLVNSDWIAVLQDKYEEYKNTGSEDSKQEILNLGWNPEIPPTIENIKRVSDDKEKEEIPDPVENMNEGYLFSKQDIMYNIDKFESGECNVCFVTGLMGSGKSTLAKNLGDYYNAEVIQLDVLQNYSRFLYDRDLSEGDKQVLKVTNEFLKKNKDIHLYDFDDIRTESFKKFFNKFFPVMVRSLEKDKKHRYIIEGVHIFLFVSPKLLKDYPVVFMNASMAKSMFRRWKRDQFTPMDFVKYGSDDFRLFVEWEDKFRMFQKSFYETYLFLSEQDMDGEVIIPRIPHNYFTENYYEDTITPRVCLSSTIEGALKAIGSKRKIETEFYVHTPMHECTIYHPTEQQVPDCKLTGEVWSKEPVRMTTIGKIRVTESIVTESFTYGKGTTGILNGYSYEWETMYNENLCSLVEFREHKEKEDFPSIVKRFFNTLKPIVNKYSKKEPDLYLTCKIMDSTDAGRREINFIVCDGDQDTRIKASDVILQISKEFSKDKYIKKMAYKIHCGDGDEGCIYCKLKLNVMKESFLVEMKRSELPDDVFGIPSERKYPMPDEKHVLSAIRFFNYVEPKYEKQLANKIIANMKKYGISGDRVGEKNRLRNYLPKAIVKEGRYILSESIYPKEVPDEIIQLLKRLNSYDYGYIKNSKNVKGMKNFFNDYRSLTISEFEKYKIGVCWDYVHYEAYWFNKHGYKYDTFYIQVQDENNECPSHTYLVFYLPGSNKVYYFESAWGKYQGIEEFDNISKLHNTIKERHISSANSKCDPKTYFRNTYDAKSSSWEHLKCGEYMVKVSKGRIQINEGVKSMVDKDHKQKGYIQLNTLRKERLNKTNIDKWKSRYKFLRHIDYVNDKAYIFIDGDSLAAVVAVDKKDDYTWITAIEISENYRGYGLSKQLLNFCVRTLHANALSVNKSNELAIQIYRDYGFKTSKESEADVKAGKSQMYYMYI